jgi:hypothetical protein
MMIEKTRNAAKAIIGRSRSASTRCPSASIARGATAHSRAAIASNVSNNHRNQAGPGGHGPIVSMCHQK